MTNKIEVSNAEWKVLEILYDKKSYHYTTNFIRTKKTGVGLVKAYCCKLFKKTTKKGQNRYLYAIVSKQEIENEDAKK